MKRFVYKRGYGSFNYIFCIVQLHLLYLKVVLCNGTSGNCTMPNFFKIKYTCTMHKLFLHCNKIYKLDNNIYYAEINTEQQLK